MRRPLAALLLASVLASCGGDDIAESATCDDAPPGGSALRSVAPDGAGGDPTTPEEQVDGARLVFCADLADPYVLRVDRVVGDRDYVFGTQAEDKNIPVLTTRGVIRRESIADALPQLPPWAADGGSWAPAVLARDGGFVLYYTTTDKASGRQCISFATSEDAAGPYVDASTAPLVCPVDLGGAIDPSPFVDADGTAYLYWKSDGNCCGIPTAIYAQPLTPDGRGFAGPGTQVLTADQPWEAGVVEAPSMARIDDQLLLFYSGNAWNTAAYAIGYARCDSPSGPCTKPLDHPWLGSSDTAAGPGGAEVYVDDDGAHLVFHAWDATKVGYDAGGYRQVVTARLDIVDGAPVTQK